MTKKDNSSASMHEVIALAGYQPMEPMTNCRVLNDPKVQELNDEQLALLVMQTNAARDAIDTEQNQRANN
ncbi:hypothetical protein DY000_02051831 [Brassica cretica]|uniref:Uncharacterized protein n=1 Tax=Brassica cretica TaxID=69181 RepID=A0ABQ7A843_BRACR|nr:hypothetical protein DY000_02051831 [Brassica cretica]